MRATLSAGLCLALAAYPLEAATSQTHVAGAPLSPILAIAQNHLFSREPTRALNHLVTASVRPEFYGLSNIEARQAQTVLAFLAAKSLEEREAVAALYEPSDERRDIKSTAAMFTLAASQNLEIERRLREIRGSFAAARPTSMELDRLFLGTADHPGLGINASVTSDRAGLTAPRLGISRADSPPPNLVPAPRMRETSIGAAVSMILLWGGVALYNHMYATLPVKNLDILRMFLVCIFLRPAFQLLMILASPRRPAPQSITALIEETAEQMETRAPLRTSLTEGRFSMNGVFGPGRLYLYMLNKGFLKESPESQEATVRHEMSHIRQGATFWSSLQIGTALATSALWYMIAGDHLVTSLPMIGVSYFLCRLFQQRYEYSADQGAAASMANASAMAGALIADSRAYADFSTSPKQRSLGRVRLDLDKLYYFAWYLLIGCDHPSADARVKKLLHLSQNGS